MRRIASIVVSEIKSVFNATLVIVRYFILYILISMIIDPSTEHNYRSKTIVCTPGSLASLSEGHLKTITNLTIMGTIDARDFKTMRYKMPNLMTIDLTFATIAAYTGSEGVKSYALINYAPDDSVVISYPANGVPNYAFEDMGKLESFNFPLSTTTIGSCAFYNCSNLTGNLSMPALVNEIGEMAFFNCKGLYGKLTVPPLVTTINNMAFFGCSNLTGSLTLPARVKKIGSYSFGNCSNFSDTLTIPEFVEQIDSNAFNYCNGFSTINALATKPLYLNTTDSVFAQIDKRNCVLHVPIGCKALYAAANGWKEFGTILDDLPSSNSGGDFESPPE